MSEWKEKSLKELVEVDPEQLPSSTDADYSFFYIDISSVSLGNVSFPKHSIQYKNAPSRARKILKDNDILMSTVRPNLKAFAQFRKRSKSNFIASTGFAVLRSRPNVEIGFIYHSLFSNEVEKQIEALVVGSNYPAINSSDVRNLKINIPSFPVQQKIAQIITTCDTVIEQTQSAITKYKAIKQGLLHDLFTRGLDANGHLRPSYHDAPELYKESELGMIPKEWVVKFSAEIVKFINGRAYSIHEWETNGTPVIRLQNLTGSGDTYYYSNLKLPDDQYCNKGDLLYMWSASFGPHIWKGDKAIFHYHIWKVECSTKLLQSYFYYDLLRFTETVLNGANGSTMAHITKENMDKRLIKTPPIHEQTEIAERIISLENEIQTEEILLQKYQSIKRGLMGDLLGGRKEV